MAASSSGQVDILCYYCNKKVIKKVKCENCDAYFHNSCSGRKVCCGNQKVMDIIDELQIDENITNKIAMDALKSENKLLIKQNLELKEKNLLLQEKVNKLEEKFMNQKAESLDTEGKWLEQRLSNETTGFQLKNCIEKLKTDFELKFKALNESIIKLNNQIIKQNGSKTAEKNEKMPKNQSKQKLQITDTNSDVNKIPVNPNQYSETTKRTPRQNNLAALENQQRNIMDRIIHLEPPVERNNLPEKTDLQKNNSEIENWQTVQRKRTHKRYVGQSEDTNERFKGEAPRVWMYLYRVTQEVTEEDIITYLKKKTGNQNEEFVVKNVTSNNGSKFKSYMVAGDFKYKENFYNPSFWPKGVGYKRFNFKLYYQKYQIKYVVNNTNDADQTTSFLEVNTLEKVPTK